MLRIRKLLLAVLLLSLSHAGLGDIIVTTDDMVLNGKIIDEVKGAYIKFGNIYGVFNIEYKKIKSVYRTTDYREDVKILSQLGQEVNENDVKTNYDSGMEKLAGQEPALGERIMPDEREPALEEKQAVADHDEPVLEGIRSAEDMEPALKDKTPFDDREPAVKEKQSVAGQYEPVVDAIVPSPKGFYLLLSPFFNFNVGELSYFMRYSFGAQVLGDIRFQNRYKDLPAGIRIGAMYFDSEESIKNVRSFRFEAGPIWVFPIISRGYTFYWTFSATFGGGYYSITGRNQRLDAAKFNITITTGPEFIVSSWVLAPKIRFDYIHDGRVPMAGVGFSIEVGYRFAFAK